MNTSARLIGYFAKVPTRRPERLKLPGVEEICSVSCCIANGPKDWVQRWQHNAMWFYPTEETARQCFDYDGAPGELDLFAYRIEPTSFDSNGSRKRLTGEMIEAIQKAEDATAAIPPDYEFLGYDCVEADVAVGPFSGFACSPLSCNGLAAEIPVNHHCLIDDLDEALRVAGDFEKRQPEPGHYYVLEVWRKRRPLLTGSP
jgi:hypothetical protein